MDASSSAAQGLIKSATSHALERAARAAATSTASRDSSPSAPLDHLMVTLADFESALLEVEPSHKEADAKLARLAGPTLVPFGPSVPRSLALLRGVVAKVRGVSEGYHKVLNTTGPGGAARVRRQLARLLREQEGHASSAQHAGPHELSGESNVIRVLVHGAAGTGKSALAATVAREAAPLFESVEVIAASDVEGGGGTALLDRVRKALEDARKSRHSMVVVDDLDGLVEYIEGYRSGSDRQRCVGLKPPWSSCWLGQEVRRRSFAGSRAVGRWPSFGSCCGRACPSGAVCSW